MWLWLAVACYFEPAHVSSHLQLSRNQGKCSTLTDAATSRPNTIHLLCFGPLAPLSLHHPALLSSAFPARSLSQPCQPEHISFTSHRHTLIHLPSSALRSLASDGDCSSPLLGGRSAWPYHAAGPCKLLQILESSSRPFSPSNRKTYGSRPSYEPAILLGESSRRMS